MLGVSFTSFLLILFPFIFLWAHSSFSTFSFLWGLFKDSKDMEMNEKPVGGQCFICRHCGLNVFLVD